MNRADPVALKMAANALFGKGKYADAVAEYTAAIDLWMEPSERAVLYCNRSAARLKLAGEKQKALSDAKRACELAPVYAKAHFRRGQALRALGEAAAAVDAMEEVLRLEAGDQAATLALAELRAALGNTKRSDGTAIANMAGAFQPGVAVKPAPSGLAAVAPNTASAFAPGREEAPAVKGHGAVVSKCRNGTEDTPGLVISESDFGRVADASSAYLEHAAAAEARHVAAQPPKKAPTLAEQQYPGMAFPPGFGPDAPDWDPTYKSPVGEVMATSPPGSGQAGEEAVPVT